MIAENYEERALCILSGQEESKTDYVSPEMGCLNQKEINLSINRNSYSSGFNKIEVSFSFM